MLRLHEYLPCGLGESCAHARMHACVCDRGRYRVWWLVNGHADLVTSDRYKGGKGASGREAGRELESDSYGKSERESEQAHESMRIKQKGKRGNVSKARFFS